MNLKTGTRKFILFCALLIALIVLIAYQNKNMRIFDAQDQWFPVLNSFNSNQSSACLVDKKNLLGKLNVMSNKLLTWKNLEEKYFNQTSIRLYSDETPSKSIELPSYLPVEDSKSKFTGRWKPKNCKANKCITIIIPYRNRDEHLRKFVNYMQSFLRHQFVDFMIIVVEQFGTNKFNRGSLLNIGFTESLQLSSTCECYVFHDVDKLPEVDHNFYQCDEHPRHLTVAMSNFNYKLIYDQFFGGAVAMTKSQYLKVNGFSNSYLGWGGEDDDFYKRVRNQNYLILRYPSNISTYTVFDHPRDKYNEKNPKTMEVLNAASKRFRTDGLNSLKYSLVSSEPAYNGLLYWIVVEL